MGQHFNANTWKIMLFCVRATKHKACKLQLRSCATSRKPFVLLRVGIKLPPSLGDQMITNMRPRTANIAKTLQIHCVSGHAHAPHADVPRNISLPPSPNTANSCGFASLAGIGVRHGAMLGPQTDQQINANTLKFMLFCVRPTKRKSCELQLRSCATSRKPFELLCVGIELRLLLGHQMATNMRPRTANISKTL